MDGTRASPEPTRIGSCRAAPCGHPPTQQQAASQAEHLQGSQQKAAGLQLSSCPAILSVGCMTEHLYNCATALLPTQNGQNEDCFVLEIPTSYNVLELQLMKTLLFHK